MRPSSLAKVSLYLSFNKEIANHDPWFDKIVCDTLMVNPLKQSGISHSGHLDMFISIFMVVRWYFSFFDQILMELSVIKQWRP